MSIIDKAKAAYRSGGDEAAKQRDATAGRTEPHSFASIHNVPKRMEPPIMETDAFAPKRIRAAQMSEQAAQAAQQMHELLTSVDRLHNDLGYAMADKRVLEQSLEIVQTERDDLVRENERLVRENTAIHTRIAIAAEVLMKLHQPIVPALDSTALATDVNTASKMETQAQGLPAWTKKEGES